MTDPFLLTGQVLAQRELDDYTVTPGVLGFVVFAVLGLAVWVLLKSMSRQLNRVSFQERDRAEFLPERDKSGDKSEPKDVTPPAPRREPTP